MLQIKYKNEFLDIEPGQQTELTRNSPLFLIDQLNAEYSTPFKIKYSDKNSRLLGNIFFEQTIRAKQKIAVELYDNGSYSENATLVLEANTMDRNHSGKGDATGYLLTGISDFFSVIKDQKLTDLKLGGIRSYPLTSGNPDDGTDGYIQHFKNSQLFNEDYVIVPCRNELFDGNSDEGSAAWMNIDYSDFTVVGSRYRVPFVKLSYVLNQIFVENGWTADFSDLDGTSWEKLLLFSAYAFTTGYTTLERSLYGGIVVPVFTPAAYVSFNLSKAMPQDKTCSFFIAEICKRYGWIPITNTSNKTVRFKALKNVREGTIKNWTGYAASSITSEYINPDKTYSFKNTFEGDDELPSSIDTSGYNLQPSVFNKHALPPPSPAYDNALFYCLVENQYFKIEIDDTTNERVWALFGDNIYDVTVADSTNNIETAATTLPTLWTQFSDTLFGLYPACKQSRFGKWGIRTLLYLGFVNHVDIDGSEYIDSTYPLASSCNRDNVGTKLLPWANVFKHAHNGSDDGIIEYWYRNWLDTVKSPEDTVKRFYYLPLHELNDFAWDDIIVDNNVPYLVKSIVQDLSYKGRIQATMQRIVFDVIKVTDTDGSFIYLKLVLENIVTGQTLPVLYGWATTNATTEDVVIYCYKDAAGTIPVTPVNLKVKLQQNGIKDGNAVPLNTVDFLVSDQRFIAYHNYLSEYDTSDYTLTFFYHFSYSFTLLPTDQYGVI